jgi:putative addiction module killer protein
MRVQKTDEYRDWLNRLRDLKGRARILMRVDRLIHGNPGDHRNLTGGVSELRIDFGPGYRVYYTQKGERLLLLLVGGDKSTQSKDIAKAIRLATEYQESDDDQDTKKEAS